MNSFEQSGLNVTFIKINNDGTYVVPKPTFTTLPDFWNLKGWPNAEQIKLLPSGCSVCGIHLGITGYCCPNPRCPQGLGSPQCCCSLGNGYCDLG